MIRLVCIIIGYLFGTFESAYFLGKIKGIDIRKYGSGNLGMTNTIRVLGTKFGMLVLLCDMLKCILAITLTTVLFGNSHADMIYVLKMYTAFGTCIGHDYPLWLHMRGGKGIAVTAGMMCALHWSFIPVFVFAFLIPFWITHYVSLGSLIMYAVFMVQLVIEGQMGVFHMSQPLLIEMYILGGIMMGLAYFRHRSNIVKLANHTERKTYLGKKNKPLAAQNDDQEGQ